MPNPPSHKLGQRAGQLVKRFDIMIFLSFWQINSTENRSVLHVALRAPRDAVINSDGKNVVPEVWQVLDKIRDFSERVRSGAWVMSVVKVIFI